MNDDETIDVEVTITIGCWKDGCDGTMTYVDVCDDHGRR
jgi:hypothetical protein